MTSPQKQFHTTQKLLLHQAPFVLIFTVFLFHGRDGNETGNRRRESANHISHSALLLLFQKLKQTVCVCVFSLTLLFLYLCVTAQRRHSADITFIHSLANVISLHTKHTHSWAYATTHGPMGIDLERQLPTAPSFVQFL